MYHLVWIIDGKEYQATTGDNFSAWNIYWMLKTTYSHTTPTNDIRLWITGPRGNHLDPTLGEQLEAKADTKPTIIVAGLDY